MKMEYSGMNISAPVFKLLKSACFYFNEFSNICLIQHKW